MKCHPFKRLCHISQVFKSCEEEDGQSADDTFDYREYRIFLPARVGSVAVTAMADSGNLWRSALSWELAQEMGLTKKDLVPIPGYSTIGTAAKDGKLQVMGEPRKKICINLGSGTRDIFCKPVIIKNLSMPLNLSGPFMKKNKIDLLHTGDAVIHGKKIPMHTKYGHFKQMSKSCSLIHASQDVVVNSMSSAWIPVTAAAVNQRRMAANSLMVIGDGAFTEQYDLHPLACAYLNCDEAGNMQAVALNTTPYNIKVKKGSIYGIGFQTTTPSKMIQEPWKICVLEPEVNADAEQTATGKIPKMDNNKNRDKSEDDKWKREHNIPMDFDVTLDSYISGGEKLPQFMRGPTNKSNKLKRTAYLIKYFKLNDNPFLRDKEDLKATVSLLLRYFDVWAFSGNFGKTDLIEHRIDLEPGTRPIHERYRPPNPLLEDSMKKQIDTWLRHDVIEPSQSPWNFSLGKAENKKFGGTTSNFQHFWKFHNSRLTVAAIKKGGRVRWCTDWRSLNRKTVKGEHETSMQNNNKTSRDVNNRPPDRHPIGDCNANLARLGKSRIFSCLDAMGAFHCIPMREEDKEKTSFSTPFGSYQFKMMGFGYDLTESTKNM